MPMKSTKCRTGLIHVAHCSHCGMFSTGETKPERRMAGTKKQNTPSNACCCVLHNVEINKPQAMVESP